MKVKGLFKDITGAGRIVKIREKKILEASQVPVYEDPIKNIAKELHPDKLLFKVKSVEEITKDSRCFRFSLSEGSTVKEFPPFRAGQYISFKFNIGSSFVTRPYSISSAPFEAEKGIDNKRFIEVTVKKKNSGFITDYVWKNWNVGTEVEGVYPLGNFHYEPLRDYKTIVALAGGSGITPFHSMAREIVYGKLPINLILIYGSRNVSDIIFYDEFEKLQKESKGKIKVINVLSDENDTWQGEKGFITSEIIEKYCDIEKSSFFICGPQVMYKFIEGEIKKIKLKNKQIRREVFGEVSDVYSFKEFKEESKDKLFNIKTHIGDETVNIPANSKESVLIALERAGIPHDSHCRSGECGYCRSSLISGDIFVVPENDGRREADKIFGYFHPCASYPLRDLEIKIPICKKI